MVTFVTGRGKSGKSEYCVRKFSEITAKGVPEKPCFYIVPEQFTVIAERRILALREEKSAVLVNSEVISFKRLVHRILSLYGGMISDTADEITRLMLLTSVVYKKEKKLSYYRHLSETPSKISSLLNLFSEFDNYCVSPEAISGLKNNVNSKLNDIADIYSSYYDELKKITLTQTYRYTLAVEKAEKNGFFKGSTVFIDEFTGFTELEFNVLKLIVTQAENVFISVPTDKSKNIIVDASELTYKSIKEICKNSDISTSVIDTSAIPGKPLYFKNKELAVLESRFVSFKTKKAEDEIDKEQRNNVRIKACTSFFSEIEYVRDRILELKDCYSFGKMCIALREPDKYGPIAEAVLGSSGIPYFIDTRRKIESDPRIISVLSSLDLIEYGFDYPALASLLKSGLLIPDKDITDSVDNVIFSKGKSLKKRIGYIDIPEIQNLVHCINDLRNCLSDCKSFGDCIKSFKTYLKESGIYKNMISSVESDIVTSDSGEPFSLKIYKSLLNVFDSAEVFLGDIAVSSLKESCSLLRRIFKSALEIINIGVIPQVSDAVTVIDIGRSKIPDMDVTFICGANEGCMPSVYSDDGMLNDSERETLKNNNIALADDTAVRIRKERYMIYSAIFSAREKIFITYALSDTGGKKMQPSNFAVNRIREILPYININENAGKKELEKESVKEDEAVREVINENLAGKIFLPELENGSRPVMYVTGLEEYNMCPYKFFADRGLLLKERENGDIRFNEIGTLMHKVIEKSMKSITVDSLRPLNEAQRYEFCGKTVNDLFDEALNSFSFSGDAESERNIIEFRRIKKFSVSALYACVTQLLESNLKEAGYEVGFGSGKGYSYPAIEEGEIDINGRIDRLDTCEDPCTGKAYMRIIDYKSSDQNIKMTDVFRGLKLQLFTYMMAVSGKNAKPAAALYFVFSDYIDTSAKRPDKLSGPVSVNPSLVKTEGFILNDPDAFSALSADDSSKGIIYYTSDEYDKLTECIDTTLKNSVSSIKKGVIRPDPKVTGKESNPCVYCAYRKACGQINEK